MKKFQFRKSSHSVLSFSTFKNTFIFRSVLSPNNILSCINPGDYGEESSNPKTNYQLQELSLDPKSLSTVLDEKKLGKPYKWAQKLCGLEFVPWPSKTSSLSVETSISHELAQTSVPHIIKQIRLRWQARLALYAQITAQGMEDAL